MRNSPPVAHARRASNAVIEYSWKRPDFLHIKYSGTVTADDLIGSALSAVGDARFDNLKYSLGDWWEFDRIVFDAEDVRALIATMKTMCRLHPNVKNATVVKPDASGSALAAYYKMVGEELPWEIEIFHSFEAAYQWFGLPYEP